MAGIKSQHYLAFLLVAIGLYNLKYHLSTKMLHTLLSAVRIDGDPDMVSHVSKGMASQGHSDTLFVTYM